MGNVDIQGGGRPLEIVDWEKEHHPFCNFYFEPREGCEMCASFFASYPPKEGDTVADLIEQYFPNAKVNR